MCEGKEEEEDRGQRGGGCDQSTFYACTEMSEWNPLLCTGNIH
jgi:hypothetical protein